jgi:hypothetical protein
MITGKINRSVGFRKTSGPIRRLKTYDVTFKDFLEETLERKEIKAYSRGYLVKKAEERAKEIGANEFIIRE